LKGFEVIVKVMDSIKKRRIDELTTD